MSQEKYIKSNCTVCDGHIEFPADAMGAEISCPHCGGKTVLTGPSGPPVLPPPLPKPARKRMTGKTMAVAAIFLLLLAGGVVAFLTASRRGGPADRPTPGQGPNASPDVATAAKSPDAGDSVKVVTKEADATSGKKGKKDKESGKKEREGLEVTKFEIQKAGKGNVVYVVGHVVNHDSAQYFKLKVEFNLFRKGMPAGQCSDRLPNLAPKGTWDFKALILEDGVDEAKLATVDGEKE